MNKHINLNILLIEDNPGDAFLIKFYLEDSVLKYARLLHAEYLKTAVDLLQHNEFDVILLDLNLPDSKGIETLETVLEASQGGVVIVLTGLNDEELGLQTVTKGAQDFLVKGQFDGKVLTSSVRYAFERYQLQKQVLSCTQKLSSANEQFDVAQQLADFGYWELNPTNKAMYWSSNLFTILGTNVPETTPTLSSFLKSLPSDTAAIAETAIAKAVTEGGLSQFSFSNNAQQYLCRMQANNENANDQLVIGTIKKV